MALRIQIKEAASLRIPSKTASCRDFLNSLRKELRYSRASDWYILKKKDIPSTYRPAFESFLSEHQKSPSKLLRHLYPTFNWIEWKFEFIPKGFWDIKENQMEFLGWLGIQLGFKHVEDWYNLGVLDIKRHGGSALFDKYGGSPSKIVMSVYSDHEWLPWNFTLTPKRFWDIHENQKAFIQWVGNELGFRKKQDWYKITVKDIQNFGGCSLISRYNYSPSKLLQSAYPNHSWRTRTFDISRTHRQFIQSLQGANQRSFMDNIGIQLGFQQKEDWYSITSKDIRLRGGQLLLDCYDGPSNLVISTYPEHPWILWKFSSVSRTFNDLESHPKRLEFVKWLEKELNIDKLEEWHRISSHHLRKFAPPERLKDYPLITILQQTYPHHKWNRF